ncbi:15590_t:CDS:1, partial [Acaulospora colombiana]
KEVTRSLNPLIERSNLSGTDDIRQQYENAISKREEDPWITIGHRNNVVYFNIKSYQEHQLIWRLDMAENISRLTLTPMLPLAQIMM